jgi:hypothetical protein
MKTETYILGEGWWVYSTAMPPHVMADATSSHTVYQFDSIVEVS